MRWESFFEDLEAQAEAQHAAQLRDEIAEGIRVERATENMRNRLLEMQSSTVDVKLTGGVELNARLGPVATEYFCLENDGTRWLVRWLALRSLGVPSMKLNQGGRLSPIKFAAVVRGVLRDRQRVVIYDVSGQMAAEGTLWQVGADFLIIAIHPRDEFARDRSITGYQLIPLETIGWLQAAGSN